MLFQQMAKPAYRRFVRHRLAAKVARVRSVIHEYLRAYDPALLPILNELLDALDVT